MKGKRGRNKESIGWLDEFALRRQLACVLFRCVLRDMERYVWQNKSGSDCCNNFKYNQLMFAKWIHINLLGEF